MKMKDYNLITVTSINIHRVICIIKNNATSLEENVSTWSNGYVYLLWVNSAELSVITDYFQWERNDLLK